MSDLEERKINGNKVAMHRERKEWSQQTLADIVGLSQAGVNTVEKGYRNSDTGVLRSTSVEKFIRIGEALGVSLDYLADRTDDPRPPAQLAQKVEVITDNEEQRNILRALLEDVKSLTTEDLHIVMLLVKRLRTTFDN